MSENTGIVISVEPRKELGKTKVGKVRRQGKIPGVVYGGDKEPLSIVVDREVITELFRKGSGENTIFTLKVEGTKQERQAMIKDFQVDPISQELLHIDFIRVMKGHKLHVSIPVELQGDCLGVRHGGRLNFIARELQVEVLPQEIFERFVVDLSQLDIGQNVGVHDLQSQLPPSARFLTDPTRVVVLVEAPRAVAEEEAAPAAAEAAAVIEEQAEPEVIRGKAKAEEPEEE